MLARPLVHNAPFPAAYSSLRITGSFTTPTNVEASYASSVTIAGGSGDNDNARLISGTLPTGLSLSADVSGLNLNGDVAGPTGTFTFIAAVDDITRGWTALIEATIVVYEELLITGTYTATGTEGVPYSSDLTISGGDGVYSNPSIDNPISGLHVTIVNGNKLRLSGTPDTADHYEFQVHCSSGDQPDAVSTPQVLDIS